MAPDSQGNAILGLRRPWQWVQPKDRAELIQRLLEAREYAVHERERENLCSMAYEALSAPSEKQAPGDEGYPGIAHDLETLRTALQWYADPAKWRTSDDLKTSEIRAGDAWTIAADALKSTPATAVIRSTPKEAAKEMTPQNMADTLREAAVYLRENSYSNLGTDCRYAADAIERIARRLPERNESHG